MNSWTGAGRLADDIKYSPARGGTAARATGRLISNRPPSKDSSGERSYDVIPIVAWGVHAENLAKYSSKGKEIGITGPIRTRSVKNADGSYTNFFEVMVKELSFGRDSTARAEAKTDKEFSQETVTDLLKKDPRLAEKLASIRNSAMPEKVLAPENNEKVQDPPEMEFSDEESEATESPFNE
jgi:single-strand DNA-binding protein